MQPEFEKKVSMIPSRYPMQMPGTSTFLRAKFLSPGF
jgi:hypothetical protein